jgi:hypothetical protein
VGLIIDPKGYSDFNPSVAKWNMTTGEIAVMKYGHPDVVKKRISFAVSMKHGIYVECYSNHDLMTICNLDGELNSLSSTRPAIISGHWKRASG